MDGWSRDQGGGIKGTGICWQPAVAVELNFLRYLPPRAPASHLISPCPESKKKGRRRTFFLSFFLSFYKYIYRERVQPHPYVIQVHPRFDCRYTPSG